MFVFVYLSVDWSTQSERKASSFLARCGLPSTMVTQENLVSRISDFKIVGNFVIGQ